MTAASELPVSGQIDRLAVLDDEVLLADFKTDRASAARRTARRRRLCGAARALPGAAAARSIRAGAIRAFLSGPPGRSIHELRDEELDAALALHQGARERPGRLP